MAEAQPLGVWMQVERAEFSRQCPEAAEIMAASHTLFGPVPMQPVSDPRQAALTVVITIRPTTEGHEAMLSAFGKHVGQRRIVDRDPDCRGLAHALAVALVLMIDPERPSSSTSEPREAAPSPSPRGARPRSFALGTSFEAAAMGEFGLLGKPSWGGLAGATVWHKMGLGMRVRGIRLLADRASGWHGTAKIDLWAGMLGACWHLSPARGWSTLSCMELGYGRQKVESEGYDTVDRLTFDWWVMGPSLTLKSVLFGPVEAFATGGVAANLSPRSYRVLDGGLDRKLLEQERLGGHLALGLSFVTSGP